MWRDVLRIGAPAGAEFALMAVYLLLVYAVSRPFGAGAQAGFGIGMRILQACFMPIVALGFAVAPVAGQNFGAGRGDRVRQTFRVASLMAFFGMLAVALATWFAAAPMVRVFSAEPVVVAFGQEYLHVMCWSFVASGVIFVSSSMFQALGNTVPALVTSAIRIVLVAVPIACIGRWPASESRSSTWRRGQVLNPRIFHVVAPVPERAKSTDSRPDPVGLVALRLWVMGRTPLVCLALLRGAEPAVPRPGPPGCPADSAGGAPSVFHWRDVSLLMAIRHSAPPLRAAWREAAARAGLDTRIGSHVSERPSRVLAAALALLFGFAGAHGFYPGRRRRGLLYIALAPVLLISVFLSIGDALRFIWLTRAEFDERCAGGGRARPST